MSVYYEVGDRVSFRAGRAHITDALVIAKVSIEGVPGFVARLPDTLRMWGYDEEIYEVQLRQTPGQRIRATPDGID